MEMELEPRVKPLPYKIKAMSRESPAQKAVNVLDSDLRTHWSTGTNTKEWILLELDEACLLSHIRIYNKSVLEWEITAGLRYKPEAFVKVRPRVEAPRREMLYPVNYTPCRFVRLSCLRGNPIAIFFIQLIGVSVTGLEPEFQPVVSYLLPHIISQKQDAHDTHLQLLQDMTSRLLFFLPQLETDLASFTEAADSNIRFLAMLAGPFYPILLIVNEREASKAPINTPDSDAFRNNQISTLTVSSNFEAQPRRSRSPSPFVQLSSSSIAFRPDAVIMLLRKAYKDSHLGSICRMASRALQKLVQPVTTAEETVPFGEMISSLISDEIVKSDVPGQMNLADYSSLFGEEYRIPDDDWDASYANLLDIAAVEEGILHLLYACASQPLVCCTLVDNSLDFWSILPLVQALLPVLRPLSSSPDQLDESFWLWKHPSIQHALSQVVTMSSSSVYRPLLRACAGYLASFSSSHAKTACVLIDLCSGPFSPWIPIVVAKVDLAIELLEDFLGIIQGPRQSIAQARAALKYIILALSGHMDDVLSMYKEVKHKLLFLLEMLEPFLDPAITAIKSTIVIGDISTVFSEKQERNCVIALNVIRTAVQRPAVLPSLESEWRRGSVAPSVLLSILGPHMPLPPEVDHCKCVTSKAVNQESLSGSSSHSHGDSSRSTIPDESDGKIDASEAATVPLFEDANYLFAPPEVKKMVMTSPDKDDSEYIQDSTNGSNSTKHVFSNPVLLDNSFSVGYFNLQADFLQLVNHQDCDSRASEFQHLALDLCSQHDISPEGHDAAIDALLLAAECYVNPFFMLSFRPTSKLVNHMNTIKSRIAQIDDLMELDKNFRKSNNIDLETVAHLETKRDKTVLELLLQAAKLDRDYLKKKTSQDESQMAADLSFLDTQSADAVTLVRRNQALLCHFVMRQLQREQHSSHEILLQSLLFILQSATELFCHPDSVIDIILESAEHLNGLVTPLYHQLKEGNIQFDPEKLHGAQRHWGVLQRLVIASSGTDDESNFINNTKYGFQYRSLVPPSSWMHRISKFSNSPHPLTRFLGWMAVSRYAKQYLKERLFLASDLSQLTSLLSIFSDELAMVDNKVNHKVEGPQFDQSNGQGSYRILYPDLHRFFPNMKKQFRNFGEIILESVGLHLKCLPSSVVPDVLCWFADLCLWPYAETLGRNAKAVILYILEAIVGEHMEAMIPEMPRIAQILISLCKASYCDVTLLDSVLCLLRPLISYFLRRVNDVEKQFTDFTSHLDFESSFQELFDSIRRRKEYQDDSGENDFQGSLMIFILGTLFPDLSFKGRREALQSLLQWADYATSEPTSSFHNYLCAFLKLIDNCAILLLQYLESFGISIPAEKFQLSEAASRVNLDGSSTIPFDFPFNAAQSSIGSPREFQSSKIHQLSPDEVKDFLEGLELLIAKLIPAIEVSWKLHYQLAVKLTSVSSKCMLFSRCLSSISQECTTKDAHGCDICPSDSSDFLSSKHWRISLEGLTGSILTIQQDQCWQVASAMLDYLLLLPQTISLDCVVGTICSSIKHFCCYAPRISWRLQTDKWISSLFARGIDNLDGHEALLIDLFATMLDNSEPEQRSISLQLLGRIVGLDTSDSVISLAESVISVLVSNTWDRVGALALSDPSMLLRTRAMALLSGYIPFAERTQLQSFLVASGNLLQGMGRVSHSMEDGHLTRLSLGLLASACLYSPAEDIALVPQSVWRNLKSMGTSRTGLLDELDKNVCLALCRLRTDFDDARVALKEALSSNPAVKHTDPNFISTREAILQVISSMTTVQSYFNFFSKKLDQESQELQEAEIEKDLLMKEKSLQEVSGSSQEETVPPDITYDKKDKNRLQQIKDEIQSIEKDQLREEIIIRRQKKLLVRRARQMYLEEAATREMELLQDLDRERASEVECEIERQRQLELERAKTRELQFNLDMERERLTQKELQRELEQVESGLRPSRREYSSNPNSRPRERYRERDNGRLGHEGGLRPNSRGHEGVLGQMATSGPSLGSTGPTVMLAGSRSFSGQLPTILQPRDRTDDRGTVYDDSLEGGRDSGDGSSMGDPESVSGFEGLPVGYGSANRHGSRGSSKSRQVVERREREGRREGKWERKHS